MKHSRRTTYLRWILLATCLLFPSVLFAADTLPRQLTDAEFWKIIETFSEPDGVFISENLVSNEVGFPDIIPALRNRVKAGGVYLGVGPEQNFTYIAAIRPKIAFVADIRRQNVMEHLIYKALFELSSDRADFVSRLFSRRRPAGLSAESTVSQIFRGYADAPVDIDASRKDLGEIEDLLLNKHHFGLTVEDRLSIEHVYMSFRNFGPDITYDSGLIAGVPGNLIRPGYFEVMTAAGADGKQWSYLANEGNYQFVRDLEQRNLIIPVTGDFGGPRTLRAIGRYLKEHSATLGAFYVSNVEQYLFQDAVGRGANFNRPGITNGGAKNFYNNAAELPLDGASTFIRSIPGGSPLRVVLASIRDTLVAVGNGKIRVYSDLFGERGRGQFGGVPAPGTPRGYLQFRGPIGTGGPPVRRFPENQPGDEPLLYATGVLVILGVGLGIPYIFRYALPGLPLSFVMSAVTGGVLGALLHTALAYLKGASTAGSMLAAPSFGAAVAVFLILNRGRQEPRPRLRRNELPAPAQVAASEVLLLNPRNAAFFEGKEQILSGDPPVIVALVALVGISLTVPGLYITWTLLGGQGNWNSFVARVTADLFIAGGLIALDSIVRSRQRNRRLTEAGRLLPGEIVSAKTASGLRRRASLLYAFDSPTGVRLKGRANSPRSAPSPLPEAGTPVAVVYVNDKLFQVL